MALRAFKNARAGLETTRGTNVAPTRGVPFTEGTHNQDVETIYPVELRNSLFGHYAGDAGTETNSFEFSGNMGYAALIEWLNLHVKAVASGTGAGADKTWTFLPLGSADDVKTATVQWGYSDSIGATRPAWEVGYCMGNELTLGWDKSPGTPGATFRSTLLSAEAATQISAFTGVGTYTAENGGLVKAVNTAVTIDATTIGTTADTDVLSAEWTLQTGPVNLYTLNNTTAAQDTLRPNPWDWEARIRRYYRNDNEVDAYVAKTIRKMRVKTTGPVLGGSFYSIQLDLYGKYTARSWAEVDGLGIEEFTLKPIFDATLGADFQVILVNDQATWT